MQEYLKAFRAITQSIQQVLIDENSSLEIKESATSLKEPMYLCLEELKSSATRLKQLVQIGCDDLQYAAEVWKSKPRIVKAPKQEIWEQLGDLSGCDVRIRRLADQCKTEAIQKIRKFWEAVVEQLINQYFVDAKSGKQKDEIFWGTGDLIQGLRAAVEAQTKDITAILKEYIDLIVKETKLLNIAQINKFVSFLDEKKQADLSGQFNQKSEEIDTKYKLTKYEVDKVSNTTKNSIDTLEQQLKIKRKQLLDFKDENIVKIENIIISIFDNRVELVTKAIAQTIVFYNDFLERQQRYQQETPEQREAEKAWISQKWGELKKVQNSLDSILNAG